jgi:hypothetical protein
LLLLLLLFNVLLFLGAIGLEDGVRWAVSRRVEVVILCLAISNAEARWTIGLLGSRVFRAFTCINTTHWGIKVADFYYNLKQGRRLFSKTYF